MYALVHVAGWDQYNLHDLALFPRLDLYHADPAQPLTPAGEELEGLDHDLSDLSDLSEVRNLRQSPHKSTDTVPHKHEANTGAVS